MHYYIVNSQTNLIVAEYDAEVPITPGAFDINYSGDKFITKDENGNVIQHENNFHVWTILQFKRRLTQEERVAIREVAKTNPLIADFLDMLDCAQEVRSDDPELQYCLQMLEQAGILQLGRANIILQGN